MKVTWVKFVDSNGEVMVCSLLVVGMITLSTFGMHVNVFLSLPRLPIMLLSRPLHGVRHKPIYSLLVVVVLVRKFISGIPTQVLESTVLKPNLR